MQGTFDPKDVENDDFRVVDPVTLPGGRPFPFTAGGTLPALAINVPDWWDMTFYGSTKLFGFFIPFNHQVEQDFAVRIRMNGKSIGMMSLLRTDEQSGNTGFMIMFSLEQINSPDVQKLLKFSEKRRNRGRVF